MVRASFGGSAPLPKRNARQKSTDRLRLITLTEVDQFLHIALSSLARMSLHSRSIGTLSRYF